MAERMEAPPLPGATASPNAAERAFLRQLAVGLQHLLGGQIERGAHHGKGLVAQRKAALPRIEQRQALRGAGLETGAIQGWREQGRAQPACQNPMRSAARRKKMPLGRLPPAWPGGPGAWQCR